MVENLQRSVTMATCSVQHHNTFFLLLLRALSKLHRPGFAGVEAQLLDLRTVTLQATQCPTDGSTACLLWRRSLLLELLLLLEIFHEVRPWWQRQVSRHSRHRGARSGALRRLRGTGLNFPLSEAGVAFSGLGGKQWFSRENLLKQSRES